MKTKEEQLEDIRKLIIALDNHYKNNEVSEELIHKTQSKLDRTADRVDDVNTSDLKTYYLYELQALLELIKGDYARAKQFINDATSSMNETDEFVSDFVWSFYNESVNNVNSHNDNPKPDNQSERRFNGNLEGWLAFYALRLIITMIILFADIASINESIGVEQLDDGVQTFLSAFIVFDIVLLIAVLRGMVYFFRKQKESINYFQYLEISFIVYSVIGAIWLTGLYTQYNVAADDTIGEFVAAAIFAAAFTAYWASSKRVKDTFVH